MMLINLPSCISMELLTGRRTVQLAVMPRGQVWAAQLGKSRIAWGNCCQVIIYPIACIIVIIIVYYRILCFMYNQLCLIAVSLFYFTYHQAVQFATVKDRRWSVAGKVTVGLAEISRTSPRFGSLQFHCRTMFNPVSVSLTFHLPKPSQLTFLNC